MLTEIDEEPAMLFLLVGKGHSGFTHANVFAHLEFRLRLLLRNSLAHEVYMTVRVCALFPRAPSPTAYLFAAAAGFCLRRRQRTQEWSATRAQFHLPGRGK